MLGSQLGITQKVPTQGRLGKRVKGDPPGRISMAAVEKRKVTAAAALSKLG